MGRGSRDVSILCPLQTLLTSSPHLSTTEPTTPLKAKEATKKKKKQFGKKSKCFSQAAGLVWDLGSAGPLGRGGHHVGSALRGPSISSLLPFGSNGPVSLCLKGRKHK